MIRVNAGLVEIKAGEGIVHMDVQDPLSSIVDGNA